MLALEVQGTKQYYLCLTSQSMGRDMCVNTSGSTQ